MLLWLEPRILGGGGGANAGFRFPPIGRDPRFDEALPGCLDGGKGGGDLTGEELKTSFDELNLSGIDGIDRAEDILDLESLLVDLVRRGGGGGGFIIDTFSWIGSVALLLSVELLDSLW